MQHDRISQAVPLDRQGTPEEIAQGYLYLCDEAASSYVTGQVLMIDGGCRDASTLLGGRSFGTELRRDPVSNRLTHRADNRPIEL